MSWQFWKTTQSTGESSAQLKGNIKIGKQIFFQECAGCHELVGNSQELEAPPLKGIIGKKVASTAYAYSKAMRKHQFVWTVQSMDQFLLHPKRFIPGNKMVYRGLKDPQDRADLLAYLASLSNS